MGKCPGWLSVLIYYFPEGYERKFHGISNSSCCNVQHCLQKFCTIDSGISLTLLVVEFLRWYSIHISAYFWKKERETVSIHPSMALNSETGFPFKAILCEEKGFSRHMRLAIGCLKPTIMNHPNEWHSIRNAKTNRFPVLPLEVQKIYGVSHF